MGERTLSIAPGRPSVLQRPSCEFQVRDPVQVADGHDAVPSILALLGERDPLGAMRLASWERGDEGRWWAAPADIGALARVLDPERSARRRGCFPNQFHEQSQTVVHGDSLALLREADLDKNTGWIVGGDFNSSLLFDVPVDEGNRQVADRMNALGLIDCVRYCHGSPIPTFQHTGGTVLHQLDYCYVNARMLNRLNGARVVDRADVFDQAYRLSDHLPLVCDFVS